MTVLVCGGSTAHFLSVIHHPSSVHGESVIHHSYRIASTGVSCAALLAG